MNSREFIPYSSSRCGLTTHKTNFPQEFIIDDFMRFSDEGEGYKAIYKEEFTNGNFINRIFQTGGLPLLKEVFNYYGYNFQYNLFEHDINGSEIPKSLRSKYKRLLDNIKFGCLPNLGYHIKKFSPFLLYLCEEKASDSLIDEITKLMRADCNTILFDFSQGKFSFEDILTSKKETISESRFSNYSRDVFYRTIFGTILMLMESIKLDHEQKIYYIHHFLDEMFGCQGLFDDSIIKEIIMFFYYSDFWHNFSTAYKDLISDQLQGRFGKSDLYRRLEKTHVDINSFSIDKSDGKSVKAAK